MYDFFSFSCYSVICKHVFCINVFSHFFQGELALAFGDLLRKLWVPGATPVAPRMFKTKLANFAPQFSGYSQHDSQVNTFNSITPFLNTARHVL